MRPTVDLTFEIPKQYVLNANGREHWAVRHKSTQYIRATAKNAALAIGPVIPDPPVIITATIQYATRGRHDAANLAPTVKGLIDGCVDGGLIIDDSDEYLLAVVFKATTKRGRVGHTTIHLKIEEADDYTPPTRDAVADELRSLDEGHCPDCGRSL